jgi:methylated-DNA-[protein]-cysteine S-methyltransferase
MTILRVELETDIGPINVAATDRGVVAIELLTPPDLFVGRLERRVAGPVEPIGRQRDRSLGRAAGHLERAVGQLRAYLAGRSDSFDLELDLSDRNDWDLTVLRGVRTIPWGSVSSYGRVARRIGRPGAARAVGGAIGRNPIGIVIPCHRVIAGDGSIGGYGGDWWGGRARLLEIKRHLLDLEGVTLPLKGFAD